MSRKLSLTVHGPNPLTVTAVLDPDFGPEIPGVIDPPGTAHVAFTVPPLITGGASRTITAPGFEPNVDRIRIGGNTDDIGMPPGDTELDAAFMVPETVPAPDPVVDLPRLVAAGQHLRKATGERLTIIEATDFNLLARELAGEDTTPVLQQRAACGYNTLRIFTAFEIPNTIGRLHPKDHPAFYDDLDLAIRRYQSFGFYVELVAFTGPYSTFFASDSEKIDHWEELIGVAGCHSNVLLELVNELDQTANKDIPLAQLHKPPAPILASHGSNGSQKWPVLPHWGYATFHTNDAFEWQRKDGHNAWEIWKGPTLTNETTRYPDKATRADLVYGAAAGAALLCAGRCFHSVHGKNSTLWTGIELTAAIEAAKGARSIPLSCQNLPYHHRKDLEGTKWLRVYQRGNQQEHLALIPK